MPGAGLQGNYDDQTARCRTDRSVADFVRGTSSGACRKCGSRCGVGGRRPWTDRRGGGCFHRIHRGAGNRAFLGSGAVRLASAGATCCANRYGNAATGGRSGEFAAARHTDRFTSGKDHRAAGSGIRIRTLAGYRRSLSRNLTRRANHRHIVSIRRISEARAGKPAAGFLILNPKVAVPHELAKVFLHGISWDYWR